MADMHLRVSPEEIADLARQIAAIRQDALAAIDRIRAARRRMGACWQADSRQHYDQVSGDLEKRGAQLPQMLADYIATLNEVSGIYVEAEASIRRRDLPVDGIFL